MKITEPLIDFDAERFGNGTSHLTWGYKKSQLFLNSLHGENIMIKLLFRPFMQSGSYSERILGYQKDLQEEIYLNDLPNSKFLELCLRIKKKDSKVPEWSPCSNKAVLRPNKPSTASPPDTVNVTCSFSFCDNLEDDHSPPKQNQLKSRAVIAGSAVVTFALLFVLGCILKQNWQKIK